MLITTDQKNVPASKRYDIQPHPDDIISMGGTFQRLVDQGHEVHVAYQTSGNIAVADDEALRFIEFVTNFNRSFNVQALKLKIFIPRPKRFCNRKQKVKKDA